MEVKMKRKDFLKGCLALGVVPLLPQFSVRANKEPLEHSCLKKLRDKMRGGTETDRYWFSPWINNAPDNSRDAILTVLYTDYRDHIRVGWGMRFKHCPVCGEKLGH